MAKKEKNQANPDEKNTVWEEAALLNLTREKLSEIAKEFELTFDENATDEVIIQAILKAQQEDGDASQGSENQQPNQGDGDQPPSQGSENQQSGKGETLEGKIRIKNEKCKNGKRTLGNGEIAEFDADGIAEIEASQAERLLTIPGYVRA